MISTAKLNLLEDGLIGIEVSTGSNKMDVEDVQVIICMSMVWIAVLMKRTINITITTSEQKPPEAVLYYPSSWYLKNWEVENKSAIFSSDVSCLVIFIQYYNEIPWVYLKLN